MGQNRKCFVGDQYDWTTGGPYDGNEWKKYRVAPRAHPLRPCVFAYLIGPEAKGFLDFQGRRGITSVVRWTLRPVIFGVDFLTTSMPKQRGFTKFSVFLKRVSLLNPRVRTNFVAFPLETTGKSLEVRFDFGPQPGFSKQLFGSSWEGTKLDWSFF